MTNLITKIATGTMFVLSSLMPLKKAEAQLNGNLEYIHANGNEGSYPRTNMFYNLPKDIGAFTFLEFYNDGGYFGKTMLGKNINESMALKTEIKHIDEPYSKHGVGVEVKIPLPKNAFIKLKALPFWFKGKERIEDETVGYFLNVNLPKGFNFNSFADIDSKNKEWGYGEVSFNKNVGKLNIGYNPALLPRGKLKPQIQHRITGRINF